MIHFGCIKNGDFGEYVGRACYGYPESPLHNPYKLGKADDIREILKAYRQHLLGRIEAGDRGIIQELMRLKGLAQQGDLTLLCWCKPGYPCHAHVIAEILETFAMPEKTLFLVDSFAHIYRAHYANPNLTNGAAFFFTRMLQSLLRAFKPTHVACVFDVDGGSRFRYALHPTYKQGRANRPLELDAQIPMIKQICTFMGWNPIEFSGTEADDVLATIASRAKGMGFTKTVLVTPDKDLCQLVNDEAGIRILYQREGLNTELDAAGVKGRLGVEPHQVVDYLTLVGDTSDNVPGIPGIGEKGAASLLAEHGTLEGVIAAKGKLRASYQTGLDQVLNRIQQSRSLVTVLRDMDLPVKAEMFELHPPTDEAQTAFFTEMGFRTLAPGRAMEDMDDLRNAGTGSFEDFTGPTLDDMDDL